MTIQQKDRHESDIPITGNEVGLKNEVLTIADSKILK